jgi:hypothetical protein
MRAAARITSSLAVSTRSDSLRRASTIACRSHSATLIRLAMGTSLNDPCSSPEFQRPLDRHGKIETAAKSHRRPNPSATGLGLLRRVAGPSEYGDYPLKASGRGKRIIALAKQIDGLMRAHKDRLEAIDAHDTARILFRLPVPEDEYEGR